MVVIICIICALVGLVVGILISLQMYKKKSREIVNFNAMIAWVERLVEGKSINDIMTKRHINSFAIYGVGQAGGLLMKEMKNNQIVPEFIIDKSSAGTPDYGIPIISVGELPFQKKVDAIIIFSFNGYEEMKLNLEAYEYDGEVILFEDFLSNWR